MNPRLSVLMCAMRARRFQSGPLKMELKRQVDELSGRAELCILEDNGEQTSGVKRNRLMRQSKGDYFAFVDDDDFVAPDYVESLCEACDGSVHCVSLEMLRLDVERGNMRTHSFSIFHGDKVVLSLGRWQMTANHLCAWRRDIGTKVAFPAALGYADDVFWYRPLIESGLVTTETHIAKTLYFYLYRPGATLNQTRDVVRRTKKWQGGGRECFRRHDRIYIAAKPLEHSRDEALVEVFDANGHRQFLSRDTLDCFSVIKL